MANLPAEALKPAAEDRVTADLASLPNRYNRRRGTSRERLSQLVGLCDRGRIGRS